MYISHCPKAVQLGADIAFCPENERVRHLSIGAQGRLECPRDIGDFCILRASHNQYHIVLDAHAQLIMVYIAVGRIDQIEYFLSVDGTHGIVMLIACAGFHLDDVQQILTWALGHDVDFQVIETPVHLTDDESLLDEKLTGQLLALRAQCVVGSHDNQFSILRRGLTKCARQLVRA